MTTSETQAGHGPRPTILPGINATTTFIVSERVVPSTGLLSCDGGDFHTVTMRSPDDTTQLVLGGTRHDLVRTLRDALAALKAGPDI